jgi:hypothetical protein
MASSGSRLERSRPALAPAKTGRPLPAPSTEREFHLLAQRSASKIRCAEEGNLESPGNICLGLLRIKNPVQAEAPRGKNCAGPIPAGWQTSWSEFQLHATYALGPLGDSHIRQSLNPAMPASPVGPSPGFWAVACVCVVTSPNEVPTYCLFVRSPPGTDSNTSSNFIQTAQRFVKIKGGRCPAFARPTRRSAVAAREMALIRVWGGRACAIALSTFSTITLSISDLAVKRSVPLRSSGNALRRVQELRQGGVVITRRTTSSDPNRSRRTLPTSVRRNMKPRKPENIRSREY